MIEEEKEKKFIKLYFLIDKTWQSCLKYSRLVEEKKSLQNNKRNSLTT